MIRLLGRPAGQAAVRGNKPWAITAYLALADGPCSRERLISLLFQDAGDPAAALRWNLAQVRRLLGVPDALRGAVLHAPRDRGLCFDVDVVIDGRWRKAVELPQLGAELLEGMQFPKCAAYETWLLGERRLLAAATESLLHEASLTSLGTGNLAESVRLATKLVSLNPYVDDSQELLVRAYALSGDTAAARQQLHTAVRLFRGELDRDPLPSVFLAAEMAPIKTTGPATAARVRALIEAGQAQIGAGAADAAIQVLRTACDEAHRTGSAALEGTAQLALGAALVGTGRPRHQEGELALHRAIALATQAGEPRTTAAALRHLAASGVLRGAYARADRYLASAEAAVDAGPGVVVELAAVHGVSQLDQGNVAAAIAAFQRGVAADPERAHPFLPVMLAHAGRAYLLAGDRRAARSCLDESLQLARSRAWAGVTAAPLALLGHLAVAEQDLESANAVLEQALAYACQAADPCWETWAAHGLARRAEAVGDDEAALDYACDAIARSRPERGGHLWSRVWALSDASRIAVRVGDRRAEGWHAEALATAQRCGMRGLTSQLLQLAYSPRPRNVS
jgi:DNA-binding SARP family transcriptional activator